MSFFAQQLVQDPEHVVAHVGPGEVQDQLVARLRPRASGEVQHPVGVLAVQVRVRVHHLRLHPEAEVHPQRVDLVDERPEPAGELLRVHRPVAQARAVALALAEPAVVHHEAVHAERRGLLGERDLPGLGDVELGGLPGVVDHRPRPRHRAGARPRSIRQDVLQLEAVQQPRGPAQPVRRIPAVEHRRLQRLARVQHVAEIERVEAAGHAHAVELVPLHRDAPRAAPRQRAEPHLAVLLVGRAFLDGEPRVGLVAGRAAAALEHARPPPQRLLVQRPLARPAAGQVAQRVVGRRQREGRRGRLLHGHRLPLAVLDGGRARQDSALRVDPVAQRHVDLALDVTESHLEAVGRGRVALVVQHQVAVAVGEGDLERRLHEQPRPPARVLLRRGGVRRVERGPLGHRRGLGKMVGLRQPSAPVELLQLTARVHPEDVGGVSSVHSEDLGRRVVGGRVPGRSHRGGADQSDDAGEGSRHGRFPLGCSKPPHHSIRVSPSRPPQLPLALREDRTIMPPSGRTTCASGGSGSSCWRSLRRRAPRSSLTVDEIVASNLEARGGAARLAAIRSLRLTGKAVFGGGDFKIEAEVARLVKRPGMIREEIDAAGPDRGQAWDGQEGWARRPLPGPSRPAAQLARTRRSRWLGRPTSTDRWSAGARRGTASSTWAPRTWTAPRRTSCG